jgi:4-amino-4-deoxy-L-arabinose transferase-like glycosyltransferase
VWLLCLLIGAALDFVYFPKSTIFPDEQRFLDSAARLAQIGEFSISGDRAWEMPGTAMFYAVFARLFGADDALLAIRMAQALLLVIQSALIGITAQRVFGDHRAGIVAATIAAFYPFFLYYQGLLLSETLFNTLLVAAFACLYWWCDRGLRLDRVFVLACLCFAAATMTKATMAFMPPLLLAAAALQGPQKLRRASHILLAGTLLYVAFMSPWWIRNYRLFGTFVPLSTAAGSNLYLGNNPNNRHAGIDWANDVEPEVVGRILAIPDELARQRAFASAAVEHITGDMAGFFKRMAKKFVRFWNVIPNAEIFRSAMYRFISAASFGPILLLAILSAVCWRSQWLRLVPIYLLTAYFTLVHTITIASLRYRLPLEPFLIVLASAPIARASRLLPASNPRR